MLHFTLENKPANLETYRKRLTVQAVFVPTPFSIDTQEGIMKIGPDTCDDWQDGYFVLYPADGSKPYTNSPKFFRDNYIPVSQTSAN